MERAYTWCDGKRLEVTAKTLIMGILNVTPDSFSDGGRWNTAEKAQSHTREMTDAGADIIDVGAESTRPGGQPLTAEEEIERMKIFLPVVLGESRVPVSVDTYHWKTADYALHAGAHMMMIFGDCSMIMGRWQRWRAVIRYRSLSCITKRIQIIMVMS